jgi:hypothetical protein
MKARSILLSALLFLCGSLMAQPYSQPPYLYSDISSIGNYNLTGKKFFVSFSTLNYNTIFRRDEYMSQRNAFVRYLVESLKLRGAVPVSDSLAADFYVTAAVYYTGITEDVTDYSKASKAAGYRPVNYHEELKIKRKESSNPNAKITRDKLTSRPVSKMHDMVYREEGYIVKTVTVEAFEPVNGTISSIWKTRALDSHTEIERLPSDCAMVYLMMRGYGKEMEERKCGISKEDPYFVAFEQSTTPKDIVFLPHSESSNKNMNLFLVRKSEEGTICLVEDNHLLSTDEKHKNYRAAIKVGNRTIECSKMYYDMRPVQYSRFLTLVFPTGEEDFEEFDIVFYKKNNPEKVKQAIRNVELH